MTSINDMVFIDVKIKGVVGVLRVMRMTPLGLGPTDDFANVLNQLLTFSKILKREYALAMHAGAADLNSTCVDRGD